MDQLLALLSIIIDFSSIAGFVLLGVSIFRLKKHGEMRSGGGQSRVSGAFILMFVGMILIGMPSVVKLAMFSVWGSTSPMAYDGAGNVGTMLLSRVIVLVRIFGVGIFVKACLHLTKAGAEQSQPGVVGKSILYFVVAIICMNVVAAATLLETIVQILKGG